MKAQQTTSFFRNYSLKKSHKSTTMLQKSDKVDLHHFNFNKYTTDVSNLSCVRNKAI